MRKGAAGALAFLLAVQTGPALAHAGHSHPPAWFEDPWATALLAVSGSLYAAGLWRLWRRAGAGRGISQWAAVSFGAGWLVLAGALCSPLAGLADGLFTAHMAEHELLMAVAAPLLVLGRPLIGMLFAFPAGGRRALAQFFGAGPLLAVWAAITEPLAATALHGLALWLWHAPPLFAMALASPFWHAVQHLSFFGTAILFWWALAKGAASRRAYGPAVFWLFVTSLHSGFLGILLTLARTPWYPEQVAGAAAWGLSPLEDQQLAGLVMWVPAGLVYAGAALACMGLWIAQSSRRTGGRHATFAG